MIDPSKKIALIAGNRLGDGLILQLLNYNFHLNGYLVTFFNTPLLTMKEWFPWANIKPQFPLNDAKEKLKDFDIVIFQHPNLDLQKCLEPHQKSVVLYGDRHYMQKKSLVDIYYEACISIFKFPHTIRSNGIEIPTCLQHRKYKKRVILHPTSLRVEKNWPKKKFIRLAHQLLVLGYEPKFMVGPNEEKDWSDLKQQGFDVVIHPKLSDVASYLYESAFFIGNDSGLAHLASNVNIPAVVLFIRPGVAKRWQPNFFSSFPVLPWIHLPGPKLKEWLWKSIISVSYVVRIFKKVALSVI